MAIRKLLVSIGFDVDESPINNLNSQIDDFANNVTKSTGFGQDMLNKFTQFGDRMQGIGKKMTTHITTPVMGAVTAVGGLTTALGFKRLVGMDNAQAKLKGLGYEGQAVEKIMKDVNKAVTGTTHTMAEGVDVAAGALAAGVKQGAELERYVTLVGDAATGANRPMDEMAQIFNRIQGSGKLMTNELNQIEHGMPGFSMALAEHLGVAPEKMREMVTAGKVSSSEFLDVMEDFAGGMSDAYAETWSGMAKNVMSNIGIIGEALIGGLFEDGKKGMAEFLDVLRSDELREWATETGEEIRDFAGKVVDGVKRMKSIWDSLSPSIQKIIRNIVLFGSIVLTVTGPILLVFGKILSAVAPLVSAFTKVISVIRWFGFLLNPISLIVVAVIGLAFAIYQLWTNWDIVVEWITEKTEMFREKAIEIFNQIVEGVSNALFELKEWVVEKWGEFTEWITEKTNAFRERAIEIFNEIVEGVSNALTSIVEWIHEKWNEALDWTTNTLISIWQTVVEKFTDMYDSVTEWMGKVPDKISEIWNSVMEFFGNIDLYQTGRDIIQGLIDGLGSMLNAAKEKAMEIATSVKDAITNFFTISSPSRLMRDIFEDVGAGAVWGLDNSITHIVDTAENFAEKGNPGAYVSDKPSRASTSSSTKNHYEFHITVEGGNNDRETAKRIREEIEAFLKEKEVRTV